MIEFLKQMPARRKVSVFAGRQIKNDCLKGDLIFYWCGKKSLVAEIRSIEKNE